jgi:hypothetical protein
VASYVEGNGFEHRPVDSVVASCVEGHGFEHRPEYLLS